jgi:hypothetical protein
MTRLWQSGPHLNSITNEMEYTTLSGTLSVQNTVTRLGPFALRVNPTAGSAFIRQIVHATDQSSRVFFRTYFRAASFPAADSTMMRIVNASNDPGAQLRFIVSTSKFVLLDSAANTVGSASPTLSTNTWYRLELELDASTSPGTVSARIDGTQFASGNSPAQFPWARVLLGTVTSTTCDTYWSDLAVNDSTGSVQNSFPGDGAVIGLFPDGAGTSNTWANTANAAGSSTNYQLVDENPPNDATDFVQSNTLNAEDMYAVAASGLASGDVINTVMVGVRFRNNTTDAVTAFKVQIAKTSGGTILQSASMVANTSTWRTNASAQPRNYPIITFLDPDGAAWTQTTVDSMQIGQKLTTVGTNRLQVSAIWASVDYTPSSSTPISNGDTGSGAETEALSATTSDGDTGAGVDATTLGATTSDADTGSGADATTITAETSSADTGSGVDSESVTEFIGVSSDDPASGIDAAVVTAETSNADTGSGADAGSVVAAISASDTGEGLEDGTPSEDTAASSGDTGSGDETAAITAATSDADTATGVDAAIVTASVSSSDTGAGVDTESLSQDAAVSSDDTGSGVDNAALTAATSSSDTGSGADAATVSAAFSDADTGTSTDAGSVSASLIATESSAGLETESLAVTTSTDDPGSGTETAAITVFATDTADVAEVGTVSASLDNSDVGAGTDGTSVSVTIAQADTASGVDTELVEQDVFPVSTSDTASGAEAESLSVSVSSGDVGSSDDTTTDRTLDATDLGTGSDAETLDAALNDGDLATSIHSEVVEPSSADSASGSDDVTAVEVALTVSDIATGVETESISGDDDVHISNGDAAAGSETASVIIQIVADDEAVSTDGNAVFAALLVSDALVGAEGTPHIDLSTSDTAGAVDSAAPHASLLVSESVSGVDTNEDLQAEVFELDSATGVEALSALDVSISTGDTGDAAEASPSASTLNSSDAVSGSDLSTVSAALTNADTATASGETGVVTGAALTGDQANAIESDSVFIDNLFELSADDQAFGVDFASLMLDVGDQASALDFAHIALGVSDEASALDFASIILGVFSSDGTLAAEVSELSVVRMSDDPVGVLETTLVSAATGVSETAQARDSASVFIKPTRSHKVMPYYIREPQGWAIEQERRRHNEALWYVGENTMFVLMWHLEDFLANLVGRCPTCYESQGRIASVYGQADEYKCPDCFGTTFEGGYKALIVRPAIFSDSDETETLHSRGLVKPEDLTIESTPDFRIRTGDYCFRVNGDRYYMRVPERITLRTGFGHATQTDTAIGYNHANAAVEDPDSVAYMIPPSNDEISQILGRASRIPRDWSTFEVIRAPLIPASDLIGGS